MASTDAVYRSAQWSSTSDAESHLDQTLRINAFGGLTLQHDGVALTGPPTQRRRLALLAMLAVAGDKGVTRDKLLAMLWPDGDPEKSRHALNQILSAQRRHFADAQLFDGKKTVRLNRALITSDVHEFERAMLNDDLDTAVVLYSGPFLDGFFVPSSGEFERWVSDQRERFSARLSDALDDAARKAEHSNDLELAVRRRRQSAAIDKLDSARAIRLAETLVRSGNRASALRALHECQKRIKDELGFSDPDLMTRISNLALELDGRH